MKTIVKFILIVLLSCNSKQGTEKVIDKKKSYLETLREYQLTGDHKTDLDAIKAKRLNL